MRQTDTPEAFEPLGGPIRPTTETTTPPVKAETVNRDAFVYSVDGKFFTARPANEVAK